MLTKYRFALVIALASVVALAAPGFAQTSSDAPGGGATLRPVSGAGELSGNAGLPSLPSFWDGFGLALQQHLPFAVLRWAPVAPERAPVTTPRRSALQPRVGYMLGGLRGRP